MILVGFSFSLFVDFRYSNLRAYFLRVFWSGSSVLLAFSILGDRRRLMFCEHSACKRIADDKTIIYKKICLHEFA